MNDPWERPEADVGDIGRQAFEVCCRALAATIGEQRSTAVLVRGEPGSGKTHLMRRLRAHLAGNPDVRLRETLLVYIRLTTTSNMIWRHFRRRIADDLLRATPDGTTQLEWLVYHLLANPGSRGELLDQWKRDLPGGLPWDERGFVNGLAAFLRCRQESVLQTLDIFQTLEGGANLPPALARVLHRLVHRRDVGLVRAWLRGDSLAAEDLERLGIPEDALYDEDPEYAAREMVLVLARMAGTRMPIILCFDQVEALATNPSDLSGFPAFGTAVTSLHDETRNLVLISCMQSSELTLPRGAYYDRIAEWEAHLPLLGRPAAMGLIEARLASAGLNWVPPAEIEAVFDAQGLASARRILAKAADLFDRTQAPATMPPVLRSTFLQQEWDRRVNSAVESLTEGSVDEVLDQGIPALIAATRRTWRARAGSRDIDIRLESDSGPLGVSLCNQKNLTSLAGKLRRLTAYAKSAGNARLVLVRDPRLPIGKNARATRRYLDELMKGGARLVRPSLEALQALEALRTLLADARSGDLTQDGSPVSAETVQDWIARNLPASLETLVEDLTGSKADSAATAQLREDLLALLEERCLVTLEEAARETHQEASLLRQMARAAPEMAGFLEGPPAVLYRVVPAPRF